MLKILECHLRCIRNTRILTFFMYAWIWSMSFLPSISMISIFSGSMLYLASTCLALCILICLCSYVSAFVFVFVFICVCVFVFVYMQVQISRGQFCAWQAPVFTLIPGSNSLYLCSYIISVTLFELISVSLFVIAFAICPSFVFHVYLTRTCFAFLQKGQ